MGRYHLRITELEHDDVSLDNRLRVEEASQLGGFFRSSAKTPKYDIIHTHETRPHSFASRDEPCLERANDSREGRSRD